ncbi:MAG: flagellar brake domain-containing protein [Synergistaceae bacterium]|jgi:c-di-GMP-binding flagellar brake protein YcgR|nr:flagellar brake domain-containing protein [Synergistaceae bacterium]
MTTNFDFEPVRKQLEGLINSRVELVITSGLYKGSYSARLEDIGENQVGVSHPMLRGALLPALRNMELLMKIETSACFYQSTVSVLRSVINVPVPLLWVRLLTPLEKVQRRMFVRVSSSIKADAFFLEAEVEPQDSRLPLREWFPVRVSDISLGGVGITIKQALTHFCFEGGRYLLLMSIGGMRFFIVGKLVKILKKNETNIEVGLAYEGLPASTEKLMGGYIRQQELITRG